MARLLHDSTTLTMKDNGSDHCCSTWPRSQCKTTVQLIVARLDHAHNARQRFRSLLHDLTTLTMPDYGSAQLCSNLPLFLFVSLTFAETIMSDGAYSQRVLHYFAQLSTDNMLDQELPVGLLSWPRISLLMSPAIGITDVCTAWNVQWGKTHYNEYNIVLMNMHNLPSPCTCQISFFFASCANRFLCGASVFASGNARTTFWLMPEKVDIYFHDLSKCGIRTIISHTHLVWAAIYSYITSKHYANSTEALDIRHEMWEITVSNNWLMI